VVGSWKKKQLTAFSEHAGDFPKGFLHVPEMMRRGICKKQYRSTRNEAGFGRICMPWRFSSDTLNTLSPFGDIPVDITARRCGQIET